MTQKTIISNINILNTNLKMNPLIHLFIVLISLSSIFSYIHNPKNFLICNKLNCPPSRGVCTRDNKCICIGDYSTIRDKEKYGDYHCNYLQANQAKVFLLEFLIGFGAGHFYLGNITLAAIKFSFSLVTAIIVAISPCLSTNQMLSKKFNYVMIVLGFIWVIWQSVDGILIGLNYYKDSNGIEMKSSWK